MKFIISLLLIMFLSFVACLYLPWWSIAIVACIVAVVIPQSPLKNFVTGFVALFLLWGGLSFWISNNNDHILAHKVSQLIIKIDSPYLLMVATGLVGGLVAGLGCVAGGFLKKKNISPSSAY